MGGSKACTTEDAEGNDQSKSKETEIIILFAWGNVNPERQRWQKVLFLYTALPSSAPSAVKSF